MDGRTRELVDSIAGDADGAGPAAPLALFVAHSPDGARRDALIPLDRPLTIGRRGAGADLELDDDRVSRCHARLRPREGGADVEDLSSRNGLFVDRARTAAASVGPGAVLRVGDTVLVLTHAPTRQPQRRPAGLMGRSPRTLELLWTCERYAPSELPVLLLGETGTGKEVFAAAVHELSGRGGPLVTLNCAAIPRELGESLLFGHTKGAFTGATSAQRGMFAKAQGGTLFLDEVGELSPDVQAKLLRALESREYTPIGAAAPERSDARIVSATNVDLRRVAEGGGFRRDLYARLAGGVLRLPPLRQRREDLPQLARHFLRQLAGDEPAPWTANFAELLLTHPWPMNARELRMTMQRLVLQTQGAPELRGSDLLAVLDLGPPAGEDGGQGQDPSGQRTPAAAAPASKGGAEGEGEAPGRDELAALLAAHRGNVAALAKHYGRDRKQIYRWLRRHGLQLDGYR